jgi:hypothetical protein
LKLKFQSNQFKNTGVIHQNIFQKVVSAILYLVCVVVCFLFIMVIMLKSTGTLFLHFLPLDPDPPSSLFQIHNPGTKLASLTLPKSRAGHSLLFTLFANRYSATAMYHFAITTPLLF